MFPTLVLALHVGVVALTIFAAYEDVRYLRIRNNVAVAVAALFFPMMALLPLAQSGMHVAAGAVLFGLGFILFFAGLFGGGDAKLLGAVALWPDLTQLPQFLLIMAFMGGLLALIALGLKRLPVLEKLARIAGENSWFAALARNETVVPYGVAIAIATALTLF